MARKCKKGRRADGKCRKTWKKRRGKAGTAGVGLKICDGMTRRNGRWKLKKGYKYPGGGRCPVRAGS